ncbi:hypothetical protein Q6315_29280, partial [Klebsiella pneumoniae]|nr:hypothetical protein [Klebsiella pneumoniae]
GPLLPELKDIQTVSRAIAFAVGKVAHEQGVAVKTSAEALLQAIRDNIWLPEYRNYRRTSIKTLSPGRNSGPVINNV